MDLLPVKSVHSEMRLSVALNNVKIQNDGNIEEKKLSGTGTIVAVVSSNKPEDDMKFNLIISLALAFAFTGCYTIVASDVIVYQNVYIDQDLYPPVCLYPPAPPPLPPPQPVTRPVYNPSPVRPAPTTIRDSGSIRTGDKRLETGEPNRTSGGSRERR